MSVELALSRAPAGDSLRRLYDFTPHSMNQPRLYRQILGGGRLGASGENHRCPVGWGMGRSVPSAADWASGGTS